MATGEKSVGKSLQGKKVVVRAVDTTVEKIVELDKEGATLVFDTSSDGFVKLQDEDLVKLSKWNRDRYLVAREIWEEIQGAGKDPLLEIVQGIEFGPNRGSATARLHIEGRDKNCVYWWATPDRVYEKMTQGWVPVQGGMEKTLHSRDGRVHRIGKKGEEELILMKMPREKWQQIQRKKVEAYEAKVRGIDTASAELAGANPREVLSMENSERSRGVGAGVQFTPIWDSEKSTQE